MTMPDIGCRCVASTVTESDIPNARLPIGHTQKKIGFKKLRSTVKMLLADSDEMVRKCHTTE